VDDRLDLKDVEGGWDFTTPEQMKVPDWPEYNGEADTLGDLPEPFQDRWDITGTRHQWKSSSQLIELLAEIGEQGW